MRFVSRDGNEFGLAAVGYEFPELDTEPYDADWLIVEVIAKHSLGQWFYRGAILLTFELAELGSWLGEKARDAPGPTELLFTEPNLSFAVLLDDSRSPILRVTMAHEASPPWMLRTDDRFDGFALDFPLAYLDLPSAVASIDSQLRRYPQRVRL